ncbi:Uncharacterised protein [uncultured archaeon]|nr:Uncharacterised protein [uncultured archaeon]
MHSSICFAMTVAEGCGHDHAIALPFAPGISCGYALDNALCSIEEIP